MGEKARCSDDALGGFKSSAKDAYCIVLPWGCDVLLGTVGHEVMPWHVLYGNCGLLTHPLSWKTLAYQ